AVLRKVRADLLKFFHIEAAVADGLPEYSPRPFIEHGDFGRIMALADQFQRNCSASTAEIIKLAVQSRFNQIQDSFSQALFAALIRCGREDFRHIAGSPCWGTRHDTALCRLVNMY